MVWGRAFLALLMFSLTGGCVYYGVDLWPRNNDIDATEKMYTVGGLALAWLIVMIILNQYGKRYDEK